MSHRRSGSLEKLGWGQSSPDATLVRNSLTKSGCSALVKSVASELQYGEISRRARATTWDRRPPRWLGDKLEPGGRLARRLGYRGIHGISEMILSEA